MMSEFEELCELLPVDITWGGYITPDVVAQIKERVEESLRAENDKLRAENEALRKLAREAADEIEGYVDAVYPANDRSLYPDQQRRYLRDMDLVNRIRDALRGEGE